MTTLYRVNAGGGAIASSPNWTVDNNATPSIYSNISNSLARTSSTPNAIDLTHPSIPSGTPQSIFQTDRWDFTDGTEMQWNFAVTPGTYEVRLFFAETYNVTQVVGGRVFDVSIENNLVLDNYDIFADVGSNRGVMKSFLVTADSNIDIDFARVVENPKINAIEIRTTLTPPPASTLFRINAGGPTVVSSPNWQSDLFGQPSGFSNALDSQSRTSSTPAAIDLTHPSLPAGTPQSIFQTERWDVNTGSEMDWNFPVTPGIYELRLYFAETYYVTQATGIRVFDVLIENTTVLDNYDIFADVGANRGVMKSFIISSDGNLDVDFRRVAENPLINAIELRSVAPGQANQPPVIAPIVNRTLNAGTSIAIDVSATDPNGNAIIWSATGLPPFATFTDLGNGQGTVTVSPTIANIGTHTFNLTATDNGVPNLSTPTSFTVMVKAPATMVENVVYRVNAGGNVVPGSPNWLTDAAVSPSIYSNVTASQSQAYPFTQWEIGSGFDPPVDSSQYSPSAFPVDTVRSTDWSADAMGFPSDPGQLHRSSLFLRSLRADSIHRRTHIRCVDRKHLVLDDYDIFGDVGNRAVMKSFLVSADSNIDIDFGHVVENPTLSGIEILSASMYSNLLGASTSAITFIDTPQGSIAQQTITLSNLGSIGSPSIVVDSTTIQGASALSFNDSFDDATDVTLGPGNSINFVVNFAPTSPGTKNAALKIKHSGANNSLLIPLNGTAINETGTSQANFGITPTITGIDASTFETGSFHLTNTSTAGQTITSLRIDLRTAIFPDMVFDPFGTAGDTVFKAFTVDLDTSTGIIGHNHSSPHDNGFDVLQVNFNDFNPGETFAFSIDVDPTSIRGSDGMHNAGGVSGLELAGVTVSVTFSDGITRTIQPYRKPNTNNGSVNTLKANPPAPPIISVVGIPTTPALTANPNQTVRVRATPGSTVSVLVSEGRYMPLGLPGGGFDIDAYEAHSLVEVREVEAIVGASGEVDVPITLSKLNSEAGLNIIAAVVREAGGRTSFLSNVLTLKKLDAQPISFGKSLLSGVNITNPTSLQFGPDGRLYVAEQNGLIHAMTINRVGANNYQVTATETISLIATLPNRDDSGNLEPFVQGRLVTGILVKGTPANPVIFVSSSDPRIGAGESAADLNLDTNSGIISRLTWNGTQWEMFHIVRGLPRSEENHANNGMALDETTTNSTSPTVVTRTWERRPITLLSSPSMRCQRPFCRSI